VADRSRAISDYCRILLVDSGPRQRRDFARDRIAELSGQGTVASNGLRPMLAVVPQHLDQAATPTTEHKQVAVVRITPEDFLNEHR
jgi:hypothetical protein